MTDLKAFLPQGPAVSSLMEELRENRLTHALLISGESGVGKWTLGLAIASFLLCQGTGEKPCGQCPACLQMETLSHPDLIVIQKGKPISSKPTNMTSIPIEDVREMIARISAHAFEGNRKVVLIRHAEDMNAYAQNAFLKTLEEPPEGTFFLLTSVRTESLLPTIISRCRPLKLHPWSDEQVIRMLISSGVEEAKARQSAYAAQGSIGEAGKIAADQDFWKFREEVIRDFFQIQRRSDILSVSNLWKDRRKDSDMLFSTLEQLFSQIMHRSLHLTEQPEKGQKYPEKWERFAENAVPEDFSNLMDALVLARRRTEANVNFQAVTEQLILSMMEAVSK